MAFRLFGIYKVIKYTKNIIQAADWIEEYVK